MPDQQQANSWQELFKQGKYKEVVPLLKEHLAFNPSDISAHNSLAVSYVQTGEKEAAVAEFLKLTEMEPNNAQNFCNLGIAYEICGSLQQAKASLEKALEIDPSYQKAQQKLNVLNKKLGINSEPSIQTDPTSAMPCAAPAGLNWGASLLSFFWCIAHRAWLWVVLSIVLPPIVISLILLFKGNEIGWKSRSFDSVEQFNELQEKWSIAGLIVLAAVTIIIWGAMAAFIFNDPSFKSS